MKKYVETSRKNVKIEIPLTPNFIRVNRMAEPIANFDEEGLRIIGEAWIDNLIEKANQRRKRTSHT